MIGRRTVAAGAMVLSGCCLIPIEEEVLVVPDAVVTVVDSATGEPIGDARVHIAQYVANPHWRGPEEQANAKTDARGRAMFEHRSETVKQYPLMLHGVVGFGWQVCVEADGYASRVARWDPRGEGKAARDDVRHGRVTVELPIQLMTGQGVGCGELLKTEHPAVPPDTVAPGPFCSTDDDCVYGEYDEWCCSACSPLAMPRWLAESRTNRCPGSRECAKLECVYVPDNVQSPVCENGFCRGRYDMVAADDKN